MGNTESYELRDNEFKRVVENFDNIVETFTSLPSETASSSEILILNFKPNVTYQNQSISQAFLKIYFNPTHSNFPEIPIVFNVTSATSGLYELKVYKDRIKQLTDRGVCPFFVKFLGGTDNLPYTELERIYLKVLSKKLPANKSIIRIIRNLIYLYSGLQKRPALTTESRTLPENFTKDTFNNAALAVNVNKKNFVFVATMLEYIDTNVTKTFSKELFDNQTLTPKLWAIVFQIALACYALSLARVTHNDLHHNNIFIQQTNSDQLYVFRVEDAYYKIVTSDKVKLFDFDRAYSFGHGDNPLNNTISSRRNRNIEQLDIVKLLCYVYKKFLDDDIFNIFIPANNNVLKEYWKQVYRTGRCFLRVGQEQHAVPESEYDKLLKMPEIIKNIAQKSSYYVVMDDYNGMDKNNFYLLSKNTFDEYGNLNVDVLRAMKEQSFEMYDRELLDLINNYSTEEYKNVNMEVERLTLENKMLKDELMECNKKLNEHGLKRKKN